MSANDNWVRELDARQRAMLSEMGVRVWLPKPGAPVAETLPVAEPAVAEPAVPAAMQPAPLRPAPPPQQGATPVVRATPATTPPLRPAPPATAVAVSGTAPQALRGDVDTLDWPALRQAVASCQACGLCRTRRNTVFGVGDEQADWMIVGEAPGENEDRQGEPFVGAAGQLLDAMLRACQRERTALGARGAYIANVIKCRPPSNRNPTPEEVARCEPFLARQVALVQPRVIVAMGRFAVQALLQTNEPIGKLRGRVHRYQGVPVIVTYHPAYLLRTPTDKGKAWADLCLAMEQ